MNTVGTPDLDAVDLGILRELARDARISVAELGRRVSLSRPAVAERVRRLEEGGVIRGYRADLDLARLGLGLQARVALRPRYRSRRDARRLRERLLTIGHVLSCVHVTGENCYELTVAVRDARHLEEVVEELTALGDTTTSVVLSELVLQGDADVTAWVAPR
ncbi:Lrp/AsnC family transcriptional regulator [Allostreptomyces psammosilenae]|uniref:Lrp/AsnC family leucine-responsive transcriptional regulator n=1 Tax=Allostreptomyces psammosilenae TaxID=1892865 RepID=A0A852ZQ79_9ACTN|nr:Lrp/AsnC family transcriptional regulator [Allostreptomyces psammosilenae]NYI04529.1 Lrp/AsnC family leucine-responsive transcriptional regulator [Allostreptomyces psammosilenae]